LKCSYAPEDAGPMAKLMLAKAKENGIDIIGIVEAGDVQFEEPNSI